MSIYLKNIGVSMGASMLSLGVLADQTINQTANAVTLTSDSDTKKLLISAVTSILSTLVLKIYDDLKKRRREKRTNQPDNKNAVKEG